MIHDKEVNYLKTALALNDIGVDQPTADLIWRTVWKLHELGGDFSLKDAANLRAQVERDYKERQDGTKSKT